MLKPIMPAPRSTMIIERMILVVDDTMLTNAKTPVFSVDVTTELNNN